MDQIWHDFICEEKKKDYYHNLQKFLIEENAMQVIYPSREMIFNSLYLTPFSEVKVIILGQDPYFNPSQAHGLAFSVPMNVPLPPSLRNIFQEIECDLGIKMPRSGDLSKWSRQGVLLLNTILTVRAGNPLSHANKGWETFTDNIIAKLNQDSQPKVFLLWGNNAKQKETLITNPCHLVLKASHPSPLGYHVSFKGCCHFSKTNKFLIDKGRRPIDWQL